MFLERQNTSNKATDDNLLLNLIKDFSDSDWSYDVENDLENELDNDVINPLENWWFRRTWTFSWK